MNSQTIDLTFAGKCGDFCASGSVTGAAHESRCKRSAKASEPKPSPARCRKLRREGKRCSNISASPLRFVRSVHVDKLIQTQEHMAQLRECQVGRDGRVSSLGQALLRD